MIPIFIALYFLVGLYIAEKVDIQGPTGASLILTIIASWIGMSVVWPLIVLAHLLQGDEQ